MAVAVLLGTVVSAVSIAYPQVRTSASPQDPVQANVPFLLRQAEEHGIYDGELFPVVREVNPYYLRGDFDGDGGTDLAFWVEDSERHTRGVAILHATLDTLRVYGAGRPRPSGGGSRTEVSAGTWRVLPAGHVESHPYGNIPEIGVTDGVPFTFERETLELVHPGKSAFVFYWAKGRYWEFWTAD